MTTHHPEAFIFILSSAFVFILFGFHHLSNTGLGRAMLVVMRKRQFIIAYLLGAGALALLVLSEDS